MKYGEGSATNKKAAKEAAAQQTIEKLEAEGNNVP
jgi:dsRNA-specific ribonuclease